MGGTYTRLVYRWYQNISHVIAVLIVSHAENEKTRMKKILKQVRNSRQRQDIFPVSNLENRKIKTLLLSPIHLAHHPFAATAFTPLSLRCHIAIAPLSLRCCCSCCRYEVAPAITSAIAPLSFCFRSAVTPLLLRCRSAAAYVAPLPLLSLLLSLLCHC